MNSHVAASPGHLSAGGQQPAQHAEKRAAVSVQLQAALAGDQQLQQQHAALGPPAPLRGRDETREQSVGEATQLHHGLHAVHLTQREDHGDSQRDPEKTQISTLWGENIFTSSWGWLVSVAAVCPGVCYWHFLENQISQIEITPLRRNWDDCWRHIKVHILHISFKGESNCSWSLN